MNEMADPRRRPITFTGGTLDRADAIRSQPARLAQAWADPRARRLLLDGLDPRLAGDLIAREAIPANAVLSDHALLGLEADGAPLFVSLDAGLAELSAAQPLPPSNARTLVALLAPEEAAIYGAARSLVDWHMRHPYCAVCGGPTGPVKAGWSRRCARCESEHFPRVDPVVIMLAEFGDKVLVGRNPRFPPGRFSALAGFVEPGETIEEAVRREIFEEVGVRVGRVDYLMSQPWPFPSQLMIACMAQALDDAVHLDTNEIAEAIWVSREEVARAFAGEADARFEPPMGIAIAHHMLRHWLAG